MKKTIFITAFIAAFCLVSCQQKEASEGEQVMLSVTIPGLETKATGVQLAHENNISDVQLFVFGSNGVLENYAKNNAANVKVSVASGTKNIYAAVNAPDLSGVTTESDLRGFVTSLDDNSTTKFVMFGQLMNEPVSAASNSKTIIVSRVVAKIVLQRITRSFSNPVLGSAPMTIDAVYLTDVAGNAILDNANLSAASPSTRVWYNKLQYAGEGAGLLHDNISISIADGASYNMEHEFYPYPNMESSMPSGVAAGTWTTRRTMLVIEATLNGSKTYYPVYLPALQSNRVYTITGFTLTRKGSDYPWLPVEDDTVSFTIVPEDWQNGGNWPETI